MNNLICITCGNQFAATDAPPARCPICEDERQYVNPNGQTWTTLGAMQGHYRNVINQLEAGLWGIATAPKFGIGQRALLVQTPAGNVLWDCVSYLDDATIAAVNDLGGIAAMGLSHPHMFGSMVAWSHAFGNAPIYLHESYRPWVQRPDDLIHYWEGDRIDLKMGISLHCIGGHFEGSSLLLWPAGADGRGAVFTSDTLHVTPDRRHVAFMYSFPNYIPLSAATVDTMLAKVMPLSFDRIYSHFHNLEIAENAQEAIRRSAERHKRAIGTSI